MAERRPRTPQAEERLVEREQKDFDPRTMRAFDFLTNQVDYSGKTYDEIMATDDNLDGMRTVEVKRGRSSTQNTLYMSELLIGSKYSDNTFFNELIEEVAALPADYRPDQIVMSGLFMGDFGGRKKNSRWMLKPGLRTLEDQFRAGRQKLDQLHELGIPVIYSRSDNDTDIIEEMTYEGFRQLEKLGKMHTKEHNDDDDVARQWSLRERFKANPNWPEYYRFTKYVAFPYCMRTGHMLRTADEVKEATDGAYNEPEREILFDAYKRMSNGQRLLAKHLTVLDREALKDGNGLTIVGDFEHHITTRGKEYTDLIRHKFQTSSGTLSNYLSKPKQIADTLASEGVTTHDSVIITGQQEAVGVIQRDGKSIHSIGGLQSPQVALREDGDIFTSPANTVARTILGRGRFHEPNATAIERTDDGRHLITFFDRGLREVSESLSEETVFMEICDEQIGSLSARIDYLLAHLDRVAEVLKTTKVVLNFGGDRLHGRNYSDFPRESGRTGLMGMDQQDDLSLNVLNLWLDSLTRQQFDNLTVNVTTGNHEWNSGTTKWHGYSFASPVYYTFVSGFMNAGYTREEAERRVNFHDTIVTDNGEPFKTFSTIVRLGEVGVELRHFFGKGGGLGGQPPAMMALKNAVQLGDMKKDIHVTMSGHYHHPTYVQSNGKVHFSGGSFAGITGYEYDFGLTPVIGASSLRMAPDRPARLEIDTEETYIKHKIKRGPFSDEEIAEKYGLRNDHAFDPYVHGLYTGPEAPHSARQKLALLLGNRAAYSAARTGYLSRKGQEAYRH